MIHELARPLWLSTPDGVGLAILVERLSMEHSLYWTCIDERTGQIWTYPNEKVRALKNFTLDRLDPEHAPPREG